MKIEYNDTKKFTRFKELKSGGIFHNPMDNLIYMKIEDIYCVDDAIVYAVDATLYVKE